MKKIIENLLIANMTKFIETGVAADIPAALYDLKCGEFIDTVDDIKRYMYKSIDTFVDTFIAGNRHDLVDILNGKKINNVSIVDDRDLYQLCHISTFMDCMANPISVNEMVDLMKRSGLSTHMLNEIYDYWSDLTNNECLTGTDIRALRQLPSVMTNGMTPSQYGALPRLAYIFHNGEIFDDLKLVVKVCEDINKLGPAINWQMNKEFLGASEGDKDKIRSIVAEIIK